MDQVGYARVSTREERQVFDRQIDALRAAGCHRIFDNRGSRSDPLCPYRKFSHGCCPRTIFGLAAWAGRSRRTARPLPPMQQIRPEMW